MLVIDTHIHVYPHYDTDRLLSAFRRNLHAGAPQNSGTTAALVLVEREGTDVFEAWRKGERLPPNVQPETLDESAMRLLFPDGDRVVVLAGCQVACRERIEVLGLGCRVRIADGTAANDAVLQILAAGGIPVLAWGVGKWLFKRAGVVRELLAQFPPSKLLLGDTSLRPVFWPEPRPMRKERLAGRRVLAGSDPLPPAGEEDMAGRYFTLLDTHCPVTGTVAECIRQALRDPSIPVQHAGHRNSLAEFLRRSRCTSSA